MPDQPQNPQGGQSPNAARIQAMLNDLAAQRARATQGGTPPVQGAPVNLPVVPAPRPSAPFPAPVSPSVTTPAPQPIAQQPAPSAPQSPVPAPLPPSPVRPQPVMQPNPPQVPTTPSSLGVVPVAGPAPAPAPRELPVIPTPRPAPPPLAPQMKESPAPAPQAPKLTAPEFVGQVRTMAADMGNLTVGLPPAPVKTISPQGPLPSGPLPDRPPAQTPVQAPVIIAPPAPSSGSMGRKILWFIVGLLVLGLLGVLAVTMLSGRSQVAVSTPSPSAQASATPTVAPVRNLSSYFGIPSNTISKDQLGMDESRSGAFRELLKSMMPPGKSGKNVLISGASRSNDVLDAFGTYWAGDAGPSQTSLGNDYAFLVFGQSEIFDAEGLIVADAPVEPRVVGVFELTNASEVRQSVEQWQVSGGIVEDLRYMLDLDPSKATPATFADGTYRQIPIRYMNFPLADRSIDLALVLASNGKNYFVISGSRESMFWAIDILTK